MSEFRDNNELNPAPKYELEALMGSGLEVLKNSPDLFVSIDLESDGIAGKGSLLQVGAADCLDLTNTFESDVRPVEGMGFIPSNREFCKSVGLDPDAMADAPEADEVIEKLDQWLSSLQQMHNKQRLVFVGFNAGYDHSLLWLYYETVGKKFPFEIKPLDIPSQAFGELDLNSWGQTSKSKLPDYLRPKDEFSHKAVDDSVWQGKMLLATMGLRQANLKSIK
ncbi:hypothetical protein HYX70_04995 [Candidatus Saccharibacteria bacterium]|nr:hypothetical protein [Candidatus Saccharibacteria bacterium]